MDTARTSRDVERQVRKMEYLFVYPALVFAVLMIGLLVVGSGVGLWRSLVERRTVLAQQTQSRSAPAVATHTARAPASDGCLSPRRDPGLALPASAAIVSE